MFTTGVKGLDELIGVMRAPYTVLVAGHPGAGKTTLASTMCYENALRGNKCLYVSFYEDKEKLYRYMERLGIKLSEAESKNTVKFLKLPTSLDLESLIEVLSKNIEEGFDVIVIDSVNVLLEAAKDQAEKRAWLLNYFYQLPSLVNGLLILVSELPFGEEKIGLGSIEFVVDAMLVLKHRIEDRLLVRLLEVRKARGAPLYVAEVPFTIAENKGVEILLAPRLCGLPGEGEPIEVICSALRNRIDHIHKNHFINIFYHPGAVYGADDLVILLAYAVKYNWKVLVLSYVSPPDLLEDALLLNLERHSLKREVAKKVVNKYFLFTALNPYAYSIHELALREQAILSRVNPDIVVFHGTHALIGLNFAQHFKTLYNEVLSLKSKHIGVVRIGNCIDEARCNAESSISDLTIKYEPLIVGNEFKFKLSVFRRFREPFIVTREEFLKCIEECIEVIRQEASKLEAA